MAPYPQWILAMISATIVLLGALVFMTLWIAMSHVASQRHLQRQIEIATHGEYCQGRVLAVQRPFLLESATRLYFEFAPPGAERPVQCCHTEHRRPDQLAASLPTAGTFVTVRYLPSRPHEAVIGKLVSSLG